MDNSNCFKYYDFMSEDFPFKIEIRHNANLPNFLHSHDALQICYVTKGTCLHCVQGMQSVIVKGDIFAIPPYLEHSLHIIENNEVEIIQIDFMPFFINENMRDLSRMDSFVDFAYIQPIVSYREKLLPKLNISIDNHIIVEQLIESMQKELRTKADGYKLYIKADLLKLLVILGREYRNYPSRIQESYAIRQYRQALNNALEYIEANYVKEIKLEDAAAKANMTPSYFSHIFSLIKGKTFVEYLNYLRIHKVMDLLCNSDKTITEICFSAGYNNLGHFNRSFKSITGITPSAYRKGKHARALP